MSLLVAVEGRGISRCLLHWGVLGPPGSRNLQCYLPLKAVGGGGHCEFLVFDMPHSPLLFVCARFP